jgi:hypothetical protein
MHLYIQTNLTPKKLNCMDHTSTHNKWRTQGAFEMLENYMQCVTTHLLKENKYAIYIVRRDL